LLNNLLDPTFGAGGKVTTFVGSSNSYANAMAVQPDGKIVVAGVPLLTRYNSDGTLDTSFGTNGIVTNSGLAGGSDLVIQPDGKILVVGGGGGRPNTSFHVARFNSNGSPDTSFGTNGIAIPLTFQNPNLENSVSGNSIALGPNGKILVAGDFFTEETRIWYFLASLNSNGSLDTWNYFDLSVETNLTAMAVQPDGKILLAGTIYPTDFRPSYYYGPSLGFARAYYTTNPSDGSTYL